MSFGFFRWLVRGSRHALPSAESGVLHGPRFRFTTLATVGAVAYVGGIATVPLAGYAIYYGSSLKKAVDTFTPAMQILMGTGDQMKVDKIPSHILGSLRRAVKAYVAYIPGSGFVVDRTFDKIDETVDEHAEEANEIIGQAYIDIFNIIQHGKNNHESHSALEVFGVCRRLLEDLRKLGGKAGLPLVQQLQLDRHAEAVGTRVANMLQGVREKHPEWEGKEVSDTLKAHGRRVTDSIGQFAGKAGGSLKERFGTSKGDKDSDREI